MPERAKTSNRELENAANCQKMPESARIAAESQKEPRWTLKDFPQVFPKLFPEVFAGLPENASCQRARKCRKVPRIGWVPESRANCQREPEWTPQAFPQVFIKTFSWGFCKLPERACWESLLPERAAARELELGKSQKAPGYAGKSQGSDECQREPDGATECQPEAKDESSTLHPSENGP